MIKIWGRASSSNVQALMWAIGELGLDYKRVDAGFIYGGLDTAEFKSLNPNRTIPVLKDGIAAPIWETGAILRYLASTYGDAHFWPTNPQQLAVIDQWAEWSKINVALNFTAPIFWRVARTAPANWDLPAIHFALDALDGFLQIAERQLERHPFLAGDYFTLADIQFGHVLFRYFDIEIDRRNHANLNQYYNRLLKRPAYQAHVAIPYDELRVT
ncbi:glutathione S-transferase family protein [Cochlodiniinecator piscidefendens]|uniref:glutathione S-transferase family protein n=1 Tax=Cochlodiniinecator piscidefendens TaxID=2715756 RepID=UPI00140CDFEA|nr:glutathione S-transferase family protein [Cochlodiniinecator piscidefendens]